MKLGDAGTALIQGFEKLDLCAYLDQGGVWTAGWGHTGPDVTEGTICTIAQAAAWFAQDTQTVVDAVNRSVTVPLSQNQFDALVAFTYNVGAGSEAHSTLVRLLNAGNVAGAANEFPRWDLVKGVPSAGLARRRAAEQALFLTA